MANWLNRIELLFSTHRRRLESIVRKNIRDREASADIVQDVFVRILASGPHATIEDDRNVLYAAARNAAIEHSRKEGRRAAILSCLLPEQLLSPAASAEDALHAKQALSSLDKALDTLSPRCRDIFLMRRVEGLSNAEIAKRCGISVNSVEKHIARALRHCQTCASDYFGENRQA